MARDLEAAEYVALRDISAATHATTVLNQQAGVRRHNCCASIVPRCISLEPSPGPWLDRAVEAGAKVRGVPSRPGVGFEATAVGRVLDGVGSIDVLFVDSPIGSAARATVLAQILGEIEPAHVLFHDARCAMPWPSLERCPRVATASQPPLPPIAAWSCCRGWTSPLFALSDLTTAPLDDFRARLDVDVEWLPAVRQ